MSSRFIALFIFVLLATNSLAIEKTSAKVIRYRITSQMWNQKSGHAEATPDAMIKKIQKAFELWESVPEAHLHFEYAGLAATEYASENELASDGTITIVLNTRRSFISKLVGGEGSFKGTPPDGYLKGSVFLNTRENFNGAMNMFTITHEIGHALGLTHMPTTESIMFCGSTAWSSDFLFFAEQDRASLIKIWNPSQVFSISGQVPGGRNPLFVFAVDVERGRTYSTETEMNGRYTIPILRPGQYRVFAKGFESSARNTPVSIIPSWYLGSGRSTNDPSAGTIISVNSASRNTESIDIQIIDGKVPFNLFWSFTYTTLDGSDYIPAFLRPGHKVARFNLTDNGGEISSVEPYGEHPDYSFSDLKAIATGNFSLSVEARADAQTGHRLMIARSKSSSIVQAGLVGIHIIGKQLPSFINMSIEDQLTGRFDFSKLAPHFWEDKQ